MNGFLFDENLPTRLTFKPSLPTVPATYIGLSPNPAKPEPKGAVRPWNRAERGSLVERVSSHLLWRKSLSPLNKRYGTA